MDSNFATFQEFLNGYIPGNVPENLSTFKALHLYVQSMTEDL